MQQNAQSSQLQPVSGNASSSPKVYPAKNSTRGKSHKRLIYRVCVEAIESKDVPMREKIKAAAILERMGKERDLAHRRRLRKAGKGYPIGRPKEKSSDARMNELLEQAG